MTTFADLVEEARGHLMTGHPDRINRVSGALDATTETVPLSEGVEGLSKGARLSVDLELMHVLSVSGTGAQVIRGFGGSTAATHADGATVFVNPQFSGHRIGQEMNRGFGSLSSDGLFRILDASFTYTPSQSGYELVAPGLLDVWRVTFDRPGPTQRWKPIPPRDYYVDQNADPVEFPSGIQIVLRRGGYAGHEVRVSYRAGFDQLAAPGDDVLAVAGLHTEAHDLPALCAAYRLLAGREIKRSFLNRQPEPRRAEEVPPGAAALSQEAIQDLYSDRMAAELSRLRRRYPMAI